MREPSLGLCVRRGLLRQGFARDYARRAAWEIEEHHFDLVEEGLRQGLARADAEDRANSALGNAESLVQAFTARLQRSGWLGRHPTLGFALLALGAILGWWAMFVGAAGSAALLVWGEDWALRALVVSIDWIRTASYLAVPWFICWMARRRHCGWKAALWGCLVAALHNSAHSFAASGVPGSGTIVWGYSFNTASAPDWLPILAPLAVFTLDLAWNLRPEHLFATPPQANPLSKEL